MGTFKTFAIYAGAVICFGGLIFAGIRMMSGRFQDAIPGLFGALFGAGVLGWGAGWIGFAACRCASLRGSARLSASLRTFPATMSQRLLPKSGKSASHIYARLSLLQLIPEIAQAFVEERITASHANPYRTSAAGTSGRRFRKLLAQRLAGQGGASASGETPERMDSGQPLPQPCRGTVRPRRPDPQTRGRGLHYLPTSQWVQHQPVCGTCRGDQCLDAPCFQAKVTAHIDREIAARPELVTIETAWRAPKEQHPGALQKHQYRELDIPDNPDAEPPCPHTKSALIVFGKHAGHTLTVCLDPDCPVHNPREAARFAAYPPPVMAPATEEETEEEATQREAEHEQRMAEYKAEQERKEEERKAEFERQQKEYEAEQARREKQRKSRLAIFDRILNQAPAIFTAAQLRFFLRLVVYIDPYSFLEDVASHFAGDDENHEQTEQDIVLSALGTTADEKLTSFALRLALTDHLGLPRDTDPDLLTEAEAMFAPPQAKPKKASKPKPLQLSSNQPRRKRPRRNKRPH